MPKVLIGIPTLDGPDRLDRALASIKEHTDLTDVTLLVSDDGSTKENFKLNKDVVHTYDVPMLINETDIRLGITRQWNRLVKHVADADIVVLLNDDIEVTADWLDVLVFSLERNQQIGAIGLRSEFGVVASEATKRRNIDYHESHIIDGGGTLLWPPGPCFAFRRGDWTEVGGFDERYFMYYVDADFGLCLQARGKINCLADYPIVYHMGGATMTDLNPCPAIEEGRQQFAAKWGRSFTSFREEAVTRGRLTYVEWNSAWKKWP